MKFAEYQRLDLVEINSSILEKWKAEKTFEKSVSSKEGAPPFIFHEGPPSANGIPGIHHAMARAIKDVFCRYKSQKGFKVERRAGWDTHGLPVELSVEKSLGITKEDIGKSISIAQYNAACKEEVMKYTKEWELLTEQMGYWVDMDNPYVTYDNRYIETLWYLLKEIYKKGYLYKGYSIQPYSPAAGTGLSSHELNQPGCYRDVTDTTCVAQFRVKESEHYRELFASVEQLSGEKSLPLYLLAWTTTPWTLPSNTALAVGPSIKYALIHSSNPYSGEEAYYLVAEELVENFFNKDHSFTILETLYSGAQLAGLTYQQLIPWIDPGEGAFKVITGEFVTTSDGTGIVHIAPTFGADDQRVANENGVPPLMIKDREGAMQALVDKRGRFYPIEELDSAFVESSVNQELYSQFAGRYVKEEYLPEGEELEESTDVALVVMLKLGGEAFKIERYSHSYPHCWRTDKPILYYPLDSWFIKTTAVRERMMELNEGIQWKPASTGSGRFGKWLEAVQDWNLSRSRYWGTPLPIWRSEDGSEELCIGSVEELYNEIERAVEGGVMEKNPLKEAGFEVGNYSLENYEKIDLHRPYVDDIVLYSSSGKRLYRELDLIDVWFDSGAMPFAQEGLEALGSERFGQSAHFIAEGVDQTRGWFYTLHAIATMVKDDVAFKNVISNGLVLDREGNKMSKRLGNAVDPFITMDKYGADPLRWYLLTNSQPWDNLKFDIAGVDEAARRFFGTLYNSYSFFALYANVDSFKYEEKPIPIKERPEIDRWITSLLNSLIKEVNEAYENWDVTTAGRKIYTFVTDHLSNWYVRLNRKRFWGGEYNQDKISAYQTLYEALINVAIISAPIAPFYMDRLFIDLNNVKRGYSEESVHLVEMARANLEVIDKELEERMEMAQRVSSMVLALRRKVNIKVRQPLSRIVIPVLDNRVKEQLQLVEELILSEVNVKELQFMEETSGLVTKKVKPNFRKLGSRYGKEMKSVAALIANFTQEQIATLEEGGEVAINLSDGESFIGFDDVEITSEDMPGWLVQSEGRLTVALDINLTPTLKQEGVARELINRIQNLRKDSGLEVTDRVSITIESRDEVVEAVENFGEYISSQTLAVELTLAEEFTGGEELEWEEETLRVKVEKAQ